MKTESHQRLTSIAEILRNARLNRQSIEQISQTHLVNGVDEAYAIAQINTDFKVNEGSRIIGKKVGLTSKAVQQQLGVDQPDFGILFDDMEYLDGDTVATDKLIQPKIEAEIAFILAKDLPEYPPSWGEFLAALAYAVPALEIVDSAIHDWKITLVDTIADNASCGFYVLGNQPFSIDSVNFSEIGMQLELNGKTQSVGSGAACLGHPLKAAWWLARTMAERSTPLKAGEVILSGALGPMVNVKQGDVISARIGSLGTISCIMG